MASGLAPKLPLQIDRDDGIAMLKTYMDVVKQNLKMLVLTNPGERVMLPEYGVGMNQFLFENKTEEALGNVEARLLNQVDKYMSFLRVDSVQFFETGANEITIRVKYTIKPLGIKDDVLMTSSGAEA